MEWQVNNATRMMISRYAKLGIKSQPLNQALIRTIDPTPFQGIGDHDLESRDVSSLDSRNEKSRKCFMHKAMVIAHGHERGRS
jgi:hypothetical protein